MSGSAMVLIPTLAATLVGLIRIVMGARRLEWGQWDIARAVAADQRLVGATPPTFVGRQYAALVRQLEGHTEGRPVIDTRSGLVDLTRLEHDPSALLVDDLVTRDLQTQVGELRRDVIESQLASQRALSRCWLVYGDTDASLVVGARLERHVVRVVNLEDPAIQLHLTLETLALGLGLGGERSETAGLLTGTTLHDVPAAVQEMLVGPGRLFPVLRLGLRGTGLLRCHRAPVLGDRRLRHRLLIADPSAPVDQGLVGDVRGDAASADRVSERGSWCRIGGPAVAIGLFLRWRSKLEMTARSPHWEAAVLGLPGSTTEVPTRR